MYVRKESGGTTVTHRRIQYEWPEDGSVTEVPDEFGAELLGIRGGGFSEAPEPGPEGEFSEVDPGAEGDDDGTDPDGEGGDGSQGDGGSPDGGVDAKPETAKPARASRAKGNDAPEA